MTEEDKITIQNAELPTEEKKDEDDASSGGGSTSDGKKDEDSTDGKNLKNSQPKPVKPLVKNKPPVVGKIQGKSFKVAPPRMNNSPRGR